jgi:hypothetical protein
MSLVLQRSPSLIQIWWAFAPCQHEFESVRSLLCCPCLLALPTVLPVQQVTNHGGSRGRFLFLRGLALHLANILLTNSAKPV